MTAYSRSRSYISGTCSGHMVKPGPSYEDHLFNYIDSESDTGHRSGPNWRDALGSGVDVGGPWTKDSYWIKVSSPSVVCQKGSGSTLYRFEGGFVPRNGTIDTTLSTGRARFAPLPTGSITNLVAAGSTAISRCAPTVPAADVLVDVAEIIREGIPKRIGSSLMKDTARFRSYGDEYLNYEFGWRPFVSSLRKLAKAVYESDEILKQLTRNSGKVVRRGYHFPTDSTYTEANVGSYGFAPSRAPFTVTVPRIQTTSTSVETWFNGAFTYYADLRGTSAWDRVSDAAKKARILYGIKLSPDVVWNLLPWSWAIDWETNIGDVLANVGLFANDGLAMQYGYIMQHKRSTLREVQSGNLNNQISGPRPYTCSLTYIRDNKVRLGASPWGFGLTWDDFSPRQIAILAALGVSKSRL